MVGTLVETYNKKIKKYCNSGNKKRERARTRATTNDATLQPIKDVVNDEPAKKDNRNTNDYYANDSNSDSRWRHKNSNRRVDKLGTSTEIANADADGGTDPDT